MHKYIINDIWMALKLSLGNFFWWACLLLGIFAVLIFTNKAASDVSDVVSFLYICIGLIPLVIIQSILIYFANRRYIVDLETGNVTFPRSDVENSILEIILLVPYWNRMRTMTIHASEIENIYRY